MWSYVLKAKPGPIPQEFTLGTGHMRYFLDKGTYLMRRLAWLREELFHRNVNVNPTVGDYPGKMNGVADTISARPLLIARIQERFKTMKRKPMWTHREPPDWACASI